MRASRFGPEDVKLRSVRTKFLRFSGVISKPEHAFARDTDAETRRPPAVGLRDVCEPLRYVRTVNSILVRIVMEEKWPFHVFISSVIDMQQWNSKYIWEPPHNVGR